MTARPLAPVAVLFDRDGTLVHDVPYNGDPALVEPVPGARAALDRLRAAGVAVGVITNQSGVARGLLTKAQVDDVNRRVEELLGPFDVWVVCPHGPDDGCGCRKPAPGLVQEAARRLGVDTRHCAVVGDIGADVEAARAAGARGVLVPTPVTRPEEVAAAAEVAPTITDAVRALAPGPHVLVARLDSMGDVLLAGPAVRAAAAGAARVTLLCGPQGRAAADLLPGVDEVVCYSAGWISAQPDPVDRGEVLALVDRLAEKSIDEAAILTSFHQSALPLALLLRMAGVRKIAAISEDYPGSLLDVRHTVRHRLHEVERSLSVVETLGYSLPDGDDGRLAVRTGGAPLPAAVAAQLGTEPYVVVHPGASVPARAWSPANNRDLVAVLSTARSVVVTGGPDEVSLTAFVAAGRRNVVDLGGRLDLSGLAQVLAGATAVVTGNTGPAHLAAALGTPVVSLFAPTVDPAAWRPWGVPHALLGALDIGCSGCRAKVCPVPTHPCVDTVTVPEVVRAIDRVAAPSAGDQRQGAVL